MGDIYIASLVLKYAADMLKYAHWIIQLHLMLDNLNRRGIYT